MHLLKKQELKFVYENIGGSPIHLKNLDNSLNFNESVESKYLFIELGQMNDIFKIEKEVFMNKIYPNLNAVHMRKIKDCNFITTKETTVNQEKNENNKETKHCFDSNIKDLQNLIESDVLTFDRANDGLFFNDKLTHYFIKKCYL